jgi:hypothetical protein
MGEHEVTVEAKVIVDLEVAAATAARNEPAPESLQLVTDKAAALAVWAGSTAAETVASPTTKPAALIRSPARIRLYDLFDARIRAPRPCPAHASGHRRD